MHPAGIKPAVLARQRPQTHTSYCEATGTGTYMYVYISCIIYLSYQTAPAVGFIPSEPSDAWFVSWWDPNKPLNDMSSDKIWKLSIFLIT